VWLLASGHWGFDVLGPVLDAPATCAETDIEKGSVESTHKVPTSHYHTNTDWRCALAAAVASLGGLTRSSRECNSQLVLREIYSQLHGKHPTGGWARWM